MKKEKINHSIGIMAHINQMIELNEVKVFEMPEQSEMLEEMYKEILIIGSNGGDVCKLSEIMSKVLKENTGKGLTVIVVDKNTQLKNIPDLILEQFAKEKAELDSLATSVQYAREAEIFGVNCKVGDTVYLPDFKKTRKEKKQEYHFNHRKNWRKRK